MPNVRRVVATAATDQAWATILRRLRPELEILFEGYAGA
jgi:hypothetical protein